MGVKATCRRCGFPIDAGLTLCYSCADEEAAEARERERALRYLQGAGSLLDSIREEP